MEAAKSIQTDPTIRDRIKHAALSRFSHYGYNKTTMAEIAADSGMSTANIYRYFENKQEIASECVSNCIAERIDRVRTAVAATPNNASEQLRTFVLELLNGCHSTWSQEEKIHELVVFITNERPEIVHQKITVLIQQIKQILQTGADSGDFLITDLDKTARAIYSSISVFDVPLFMNFYSLQDFQQRAHEVVDLILLGLASHTNRQHKERMPT